MAKYDLVIFDLDGTILDTSEGIKAGIKYALEKNNLDLLSDEEMDTFIGPPLKVSFKNVLKLQDNIIEKLIIDFKDKYKSEFLYMAKPYIGIYEVFERLSAQNVKVAIATYKGEEYAIKLLKYYHFNNFTTIMHGGDNEGCLSKADIIKMCIKDAEMDEETKILMVGDSIGDFKGAEETNIDFLGVTYGFGFKSVEDLQAKGVVNFAEKPAEILLYI